MTLTVTDAFPDGPPAVIRVAEISAPWVIAVAAGGLIVQDADPIVFPDQDIDDASRRLVRTHGFGSKFSVSMAYLSTDTPLQRPRLKFFGRRDDSERFQILTTLGGAKHCIPTINAVADVRNPAQTFKFTHPDPFAHTYPLDGNNEILCGVERVYTATGTAASAYVEIKVH